MKYKKKPVEIEPQQLWNRWQCFLKSVWGGFPVDYYIDGHEWVEVGEHKNCTVSITRCETCGKQEITWSK